MGDNKGYIRKSDDRGSVNISEDVIAVIAAAAASEVEGVHGMFAPYGREITHKIARKGAAKGVRILVGEDSSVSIDIQLFAEMGFSINEVGQKVQTAVKSAVEQAAGLTVGAVNVHICGIALRKDK